MDTLKPHHQASSSEPSNAAAATKTTDSNSEPQASQPQRQPPGASFRWGLTLLFALAIPIFLETLDYTGWLEFINAISGPLIQF